MPCDASCIPDRCYQRSCLVSHRQVPARIGVVGRYLDMGELARRSGRNGRRQGGSGAGRRRTVARAQDRTRLLCLRSSPSYGAPVGLVGLSTP
jgi:hypothetical protein